MRAFVVPSCDAPPVFELGEQVTDLVLGLVECLAVFGWFRLVCPWHRLGSALSPCRWAGRFHQCCASPLTSRHCPTHRSLIGRKSRCHPVYAKLVSRRISAASGVGCDRLCMPLPISVGAELIMFSGVGHVGRGRYSVTRGLGSILHRRIGPALCWHSACIGRSCETDRAAFAGCFRTRSVRNSR